MCSEIVEHDAESTCAWLVLLVSTTNQHSVRLVRTYVCTCCCSAPLQGTNNKDVLKCVLQCAWCQAHSQAAHMDMSPILSPPGK